jgi:hypothetical protein
MYTATTTGNYIRIIDVKTGATKKMIKYTGTLIQGPVVAGTELSITVRVSPSLTYVLIYSVPHGGLRRRVRI